MNIKEIVQESDITYNNVYKNQFFHEYEGGYLIIGKNTCVKVSNEIAYLIDYLPKRESLKGFERRLEKLDIKNVGGVLSRLEDTRVIVANERKSVSDIMKKGIKRIMNPQIPLIGANIQKKIFAPFEFIFKRIKNEKIYEGIMYMFLCIMIINLVFGVFIQENINNILNSGIQYKISSEIWSKIFMGLVLLGIVFHELGHSIMCRNKGIGYRPISFTFFLIYPALFTNVSGIDQLKLKDRLWINAGGLIGQSFYMLIMGIMFYIYEMPIFLFVTKALFDLLYFNLHPLMRTDGYWVFKDILYFSKGRKFEKLINKIYYTVFLFFSLYLGYRAYKIIRMVLNYFINYQSIRFDTQLLMMLFYMYLVTILLKGTKFRLMESYNELKNK